MAKKQYLSLTGLQEYDDLIKNEITELDTSVLQNAKNHFNNNVGSATKTYVDESVAQKTMVQIITWGDDD